MPERVLTNDDLEKMVETNNQWILERTGISERHIADPGTATSDLAVEAARQALEQRGTDGCGPGCHSGVHGDAGHDVPFDRVPGAKPHRRHARLGLRSGRGLLGLPLRLDHGAHLVGAGTHKQGLVIGADTMSRIIDYTDRSTCVLFGDGAGAMLIEPLAAE